jgi:hypothetical protein
MAPQKRKRKTTSKMEKRTARLGRALFVRHRLEKSNENVSSPPSLSNSADDISSSYFPDDFSDADEQHSDCSEDEEEQHSDFPAPAGGGTGNLLDEINFSEIDDAQVLENLMQGCTDASSMHAVTAFDRKSILDHLDTNDHAMVEIYHFALSKGTSLRFIDSLFRLLKKHTKKGFDVRKSPKRRTFMKKLREKLRGAAPPEYQH